MTYRVVLSFFGANGLGIVSNPCSRFPLYKVPLQPGLKEKPWHTYELGKIFANFVVKLYFYLLNDTI